MENEAAVDPESQEDNAPEHDRDAKPWLKMIQHAETAFEQWHKTCDNLAKEYANLKRLAQSRTDRELQMFYANLEVIRQIIYSRPPQPVVVPRFKDRRPVPRKTSEILERACITSFDIEKVHETLKKVRNNLALTARGVIWLRYETYEKPGRDGKPEPKECVRYEWLHRKDFLHEPARTWQEVGWVARGTWLTQKQGKKRFGEAWKEIQYEDAPDTDEDYKVVQKARVWELWHKEENLVVWLHPHAKEVLDIAPPHLDLEGFFPCPEPAYGTCEEDSLIPVPDACFYKDQLEEINELTARISLLSESLRLQVFYAAGHEDLGEAVKTALAQVSAGENRRIFIPLAGLSGFGQNSKLGDALWEMPIDKVATTIKELLLLRRQLMDDVREISGVSDIMRGETDANETLGAQQLKSQYGSIRIKDRQNEMVRIADGALNIAGEIMSENFSPETLLSMSQTEDLPKQADVLAQHQQEAMRQIAELAQKAQQPPQPGPDGQPPTPPDPAQFEQAKQQIVMQHQQAAAEVVTVEKVFGLLRAQRIRPFVLQIATDSTIQPDENAEKQSRNEFGTAFANTMAALGPLVQAAPAESADFAGTMLKFQTAPYRAGREMEQSIDDLVEGLKKKAKEPPPPSPEMMKAEAEANRLKVETETKQMELQDKQAEREAKMQQSQMDAGIEAKKAQDEQAQTALEARVKQLEANARLAEIDRKAQADFATQAHQERMAEMQERLAELSIELAEVKLKQAREKPAPKPNGEARA